MKRILVTTACLFTVMAVCARVSNDTTEPQANMLGSLEAADSTLAVAQADKMPPLAYGAAGAGLFACFIAARRWTEQT